jgi:hypothetical protein
MELQTLFKREGTADSIHKQQVRIILLYPNIVAYHLFLRSKIYAARMSTDTWNLPI